MSVPELARNARDQVRDAVERDGVVRHGLARGLMNVRALAREIERQSSDKVTFDAVLGAIRRYPIDVSAERRRKVGAVIRKITLRNHVAVLAFRNRPDLRPAIARFVGESGLATEETLRVATSPEGVSLTFDESRTKELEGRIPKSDVLHKLSGLVEIKIQLAAEAEKASGALSVIASELAINDVNVVQLHTVGPAYIILLVSEADATRAYQALSNLAKAAPKE